METQDERTGLKGVGFLFALIGLFLVFVCLKTTGHPTAAAGCGLAGCFALAAATGWFLLRRWRDTGANFSEDSDVQFASAVLLLVLMAPLCLVLARSPLTVILLAPASILVRTFAGKWRPSR